MKSLLAIVLLVTLLPACTSTKYCEREQDYSNVRQDPPLKAPPGLDVPEPEPSFVIPEISTQAQAAALNQERPCLEIPPLLPGGAEAGSTAN